MANDSRLHKLAARGQSIWFDTLSRHLVSSGELKKMMKLDAVTGVTSNPSIFQKAIADSDDYDEQFASLLGGGSSVDDAYWRMVTDDIGEALAVLRPVYDASDGIDGYVSVEVDPGLASDTDGTIESARHLHEAIDEHVFDIAPLLEWAERDEAAGAETPAEPEGAAE